MITKANKRIWEWIKNGHSPDHIYHLFDDGEMFRGPVNELIEDEEAKIVCKFKIKIKPCKTSQH